MKTTSAGFEPYASSRVEDFNVRFELLDTNAKNAAQASASGSESASQLAQLTDDVTEMGGKYATLEPDLWRLDGTFDILPESITDIQTGWWSNVMSGADGTFTTAPWVKFYFGGTAVSTIGYTLAFDGKTNQYATSIKVTCYGSDGTTVIDTKTVTNSSADCIIDFAVSNYYYVKIEFLKTSEPYRRIRLVNCLFGIIQNFDRRSLNSATAKFEASPTAENFASNELAFAFDNADHKYNLVNPNGLYTYLQKGQLIEASAVIDGEAVSVCKVGFTSSEALDDEMTAEITANDYALALDGALYTSGSNTTATLTNALTAALSGTGITFETTAGSYTVSMAIPADTTKREALRLLAQAACCSIWFDRERVLQVKPLTVAQSAVDTLDGSNCPSLGGISVSEPVGKVELIVRNDYADTEVTYTYGSSEPVKTVRNPCVAAANGTAVATWLYNQYNRRVNYKKPNRCNPAVEVADTLTIADTYGEDRKAVVNALDISFDGQLSATTKAVGA